MPIIENLSVYCLNLVVEVKKESSLLLVLSLLSGEGTSGSVVSGLGERADGLVELQGFHEVKSSGDGGDGVVLGNLHPCHDGPVGDGSSGEGGDGMVELEGFHEVESSIDGGDGVVLSNLHPCHDGPVGDGSSGKGWDSVRRGKDAVLSILEKPVSESTSNKEHDGVRSETVGEDGSALEVLEDNGKLVR